MKESCSRKIISNNPIDNALLNICRDTLFYIPAKLFPVFFGFIGLTVYTRVFSPTEFGTYSLITATIGIIGVFTYSWINQSNLRLFQPYRNDQKLDLFFSASFFLIFGTLIGSTLILFVLSKLSLLSSDLTKYMTLMILLLIITSFFETEMTILMSDRKPKVYSVFRSLSAILYLGVSLLLIYIFNYRVSAILLGTFLTNLLLFAVITIKYRLYKYVSARSFSIDTLNEFVCYGIPLMTALVFSWILVLSDRYLIEYFRGSYEVGLYSASYQLADYPIGLVSSTIIMAAFPIILDTWEKKGDQVTIDLISNIMRYYLLFAIPTMIYIIVLSKEFMLILGTSYSDGYAVLPWICFGSLMMGLCVYVNKGLELKKKTKILSFIVSIAAASNILLNLVLIPRYGFYGAGVATGVAYLIYFIASICISKRYLKCKIPLKSAMNFSLSSLIMGISLLLLKGYLDESITSLILLTSIGVIVYIASVFLSGEIKSEVTFVKLYLNSKTQNV